VSRRILGIVGDATFDYYLDIAGVQAADEKVVPVSTRRTLGGTGANAAVVARGLGSEVRLHSVVGDDAIGAWILAALRERDLCTENVRVVPGPSPMATVIRSDERTVIVDIGVGIRSGGVDLDELRRCALIYVSYSPHTVVRLVADAQGDRTVVGLEAWMLEQPGLRTALDDCRLVVANEAAVQSLTESGTLPKTALVCTRGAAGATLHQDGTVTGIPPYPVMAVDATGAGDCFAATLCHYIVEGRSLTTAARFAAVAAALSTLRVGLNHAPATAAEIEDLATKAAPA